MADTDCESSGFSINYNELLKLVTAGFSESLKQARESASLAKFGRTVAAFFAKVNYYLDCLHCGKGHDLTKTVTSH